MSALFSVAPAGMVMEASAGTVQANERAGMVIVVASLEAWLRVAETSVVPDASEIEAEDSERVTEGASSSSVMVPVAEEAPSDAFPALLRSTTTVSSGSSAASPVTETVTVRLAAPAAKVRVPEASAS